MTRAACTGVGPSLGRRDLPDDTGKSHARAGRADRADAPPPGTKRSRAPKGLTNRLGGMLWTFSGTGVQAVVQVSSDGPGPPAHARGIRRHGRGSGRHRVVADRLAGRRRPGDRPAQGPRRAASGPRSPSRAASGSCSARRCGSRRPRWPRSTAFPRSSRCSAAWRCCSHRRPQHRRRVAAQPAAALPAVRRAGCRQLYRGLRLHRRVPRVAGVRGVGAGGGRTCRR